MRHSISLKQQVAPSIWLNVKSVKAHVLCFIQNLSYILFSQVVADDKEVLDNGIDSLRSLANPSEGHVDGKGNRVSLKITEGIPDATAVQLDIMDKENLCNYISQFGKDLVTGSYVDDSMSKLHKSVKNAGVTILCEMGLDPGIDHMIAMKMINEAHKQGEEI